MRIYECSMCGKKLDIHTKERASRTIRCNDCQKLVQREEGKKHFIERLNSRYPTFEYVSGNPNCDGIVLLKCKICGECIERNSQCIRGKNNLTCFNCKRNKITIRKMLEQQKDYLMQYDKARRKVILKIYKQIKSRTVYIKKCIQCNNEYIEHTTSNYCAKCRKKIHDKHSGKSLQKLFDRDNGICWLCGEQCNWNDKELINGTIVVGKSYPSIDHKIPLSKGGTDDWDNLGLAHCECNRVKGAC